jgi:hypothetical protein
VSITLERQGRASNGTYEWSWGVVERVQIVTESLHGTYVQWPESVRTLLVDGEGRTVARMPGWADPDRVIRDGA